MVRRAVTSDAYPPVGASTGFALVTGASRGLGMAFAGRAHQNLTLAGRALEISQRARVRIAKTTPVTVVALPMDLASPIAGQNASLYSVTKAFLTTLSLALEQELRLPMA